MNFDPPILSICIPVKDFDVKPLVKALLKEIAEEDLKAEIVIVEDGSSLLWAAKNEVLHAHPEVRIFSFHQNKGRAAARNFLAQEALGKYLLFIDADSIPVHPQFIGVYLKQVEAETILCGGRHYSLVYKTPQTNLHWKYGMKREVYAALDQEHQGFYSNNFLIEKSAFDRIQFDESIVLYGHEDTLFGYTAKAKGFRIRTLENPVIHTSLETNDRFLDKVEESILSLIQIIHQQKNQGPTLQQEFKLWHTHEKLKRYRLAWVLDFLVVLLKPMRYSLFRLSGPLVLLDVYKLVLFAKVSRKVSDERL